MIRYQLFWCTTDNQTVKSPGQSKNYICPQCNKDMKLVGVLNEKDVT